MDFFDKGSKNSSANAHISLLSAALNNTDGSNLLWHQPARMNGGAAAARETVPQNNNTLANHKSMKYFDQSKSRMLPPSHMQGQHMHRPSFSNIALIGNNHTPHSNTVKVKATEEKVLVQHNYCDYAMVPNEEKCINTKGGVRVPFPIKLFDMLEHIDLQEPQLGLFISWQPHGRCFLAHDQKQFEELVLPRFFKQNHYSSFRRQLNLWGFKRITQSGPDNGAYYHELFLRSKTFLCRSIQRTSGPGESESSTRVPSNPEAEPKFYAMMALPPSGPGPSSSSSNTGSAKIDSLYAVSPPESISAASNTFNTKSFVSDASASPCCESVQPLPLADQNLHLNSVGTDVDESPISAINNFFDNYFVPDRSSRHLDATIEESIPPLPQDGASCELIDSAPAMTLQFLDKMRESILSRKRLQLFGTSERNRRMDPSFELGQHQQSQAQGLSNNSIPQFFNYNRDQQVCDLGRGMNQHHHPAETTVPNLSALGNFGSSSSPSTAAPNFQQQLRMSLSRESALHNLHKSERDNTSNNDLAPIDSLTSLSLADKSLLLDMLRGST